MDSPSPSADGRGSQDEKSWMASTMERTQDTTDKAADRVRDRAEQQKAAGADRIGDAADAMKAAADDLKEEIPLAAEYVDKLAQRLGTMASALRERTVDEMLGSCTQFARQQPAAFFAGAVAAGFALSRFAKSSSRRDESPAGRADKRQDTRQDTSQDTRQDTHHG